MEPGQKNNLSKSRISYQDFASVLTACCSGSRIKMLFQFVN